MRPAGFEEGRRYPVLLNDPRRPVHAVRHGFFDEVQVYAGAGYAVLFSNPRGGSGYSRGVGPRDPRPGRRRGPGWGSVDYEDLMGVVDTALERFHFLDPDRLGVLGGSYGGYMTSWIVGHTDRFKAALSERAVNNLVSAFGSSDIGWVFERQFGGPMWEDVDAYLRMSPSTYAQDIDDAAARPPLRERPPLQRRAGRASVHAPAPARQGGRDAPLPGRGHELSRSGSPVHRVMRFEAILEWFGRYLQPEGAQAGQDPVSIEA